MGRFVALLRGVNIGRAKAVSSDQLKAIAEDLCFSSYKTLLNSGNLIFSAKCSTAKDLEGAIETALIKSLNLNVHVIVRSADQWNDVITNNPFARFAIEKPNHLLVFAAKDSILSEAVEEISRSWQGPEKLAECDGTLYVTHPAGIGTSALNPTPSFKKLTSKATGRNWNTVLRIQRALSDSVS